MIEYYLAAGLLSFIVTMMLTKLLIPRLKSAGIVGKDENKMDQPEVPEMGGLAIVGGLTAGLLLAIFFHTFLHLEFNLIFLLGAIITIEIVALVGVVDDLLNIPQWLKALLPLFVAIPLVAVQAAGSTVINIPFLGSVDFGIIYIVVLIPLAIAVCSNLTNMLAGFNGLEAGQGAVIFAALSILAISKGSVEGGLLSVSMLGGLLAFLAFNFYPAKIFPGDVGTLTIGVVIASTAIISSLQSAGAIMMIPFIIDFFIKAANGFPHTHQDIKSGKLLPKGGKVKGFVHLAMKQFGGLSEKNLVLLFIGFEALFALLALALFLRV